MEKNEILEIVNEQMSKKANVDNAVKDTISGVSQEIEKAYSQQEQNLPDDKDFKTLTKEIISRSAKAKLGQDMLAVMNEEHQNELSLYILEQEKKRLDYRRKKEKWIVAEETKADVANKRMTALRKRYGYMYSENEPFIPSKTYNKSREFTNWWNSTSDTFRRFVKGSLKFLLYATIGFLVVYFGYKGLAWIVANTNLPQ